MRWLNRCRRLVGMPTLRREQTKIHRQMTTLLQIELHRARLLASGRAYTRQEWYGLEMQAIREQMLGHALTPPPLTFPPLPTVKISPLGRSELNVKC